MGLKNSDAFSETLEAFPIPSVNQKDNLHDTVSSYDLPITKFQNSLEQVASSSIQTARALT